MLRTVLLKVFEWFKARAETPCLSLMLTSVSQWQKMWRYFLTRNPLMLIDNYYFSSVYTRCWFLLKLNDVHHNSNDFIKYAKQFNMNSFQVFWNGAHLIRNEALRLATTKNVKGKHTAWILWLIMVNILVFFFFFLEIQRPICYETSTDFSVFYYGAKERCLYRNMSIPRVFTQKENDELQMMAG